MTKAFLKFPSKHINYAPRISSRRLGLRNFENVAYREDGAAAEGAEDEETEETITAAIVEKVKGELETRNYQNRAAVEELIGVSLKGLDLEALRKFDNKFNPEAIRNTVTQLAATVEKLKNSNIGGGVSQENREAIRELLQDDKTLKLIERAMSSRGGQQVVLNVRNVVMTSQNVVLDGDIPEDILNSFSVEAFVPKRRPREYVFNFVNRRTVAKITEYKTWMEEGSESGAFAIVAEGGLKPLVSKTLVRNTAKYRKVAGKRVYTEEFTKFRQEAYRILEDLFNDQLIRNYAAIIVVDLLAKAAAYVSTTLNSQYTNPTDYHAIGAVAAQIEALDFMPDLLIMNPQDKWRIGLSQDTQGRFYTSVPMYNPAGEATIMGFRVITSNRVTAGTFILGESGLFKVEDEPVTIRMGYGVTVGATVASVEADFDHNRFRIIAETFFHSWIATNHTGSFVSASFAALKAALLKP